VRPTPRQGTRLCACPMRRLLLATLLLLALLPTAGAFAADRPQDLLVDACRDEKVDGTYSQRTYRRALDQLPADSDQYTACREVIERARLAALTNRGSGGGGDSAGRDAPAAQPSTGSGGGGGGSAPDPPQDDQSTGTQAPSSRPRSTRPRRTQKERSRTPAPASTTTTQAPTPEKLLPAGPVGNVSAVGSDLPEPVVALLAALAIAAGLAAIMIGWNSVVARRSR
jgi:hypothetical protein